MKQFSVLVALFCIMLCACTSLHTTSSYNIDYTSANTVFLFDSQGCIVEKSIEKYLAEFAPTKEKPRINSRLNEDGKFEIFDNKTNKTIYQSDVGERIILVASDTQNFYFITNADSNFLRLEKFNLKSRTFKIIDQRNCDIESIVAIKENNVAKIAVIKYTDSYTKYFDSKFKIAEEQLYNKYNPLKIHWQNKSPTAEKWLVSLTFKNRPPKSILFDFNTVSIKELKDSFANWRQTTSRKDINFTSRDGKKINAILTFPKTLENSKRLPVVMFPHGGPFAKADLDFDFRAHFLAQAGYLVVQPNYRGSAFFGKDFRFAGFGVVGIKKAQQDIEDCLKHLINIEIADKNKVAILGGSWGGYCAAYALTFTPQYYKAGVLLFGAYNLPEMLKTFPKKSNANRGLDRIQYGILPKDEFALKTISPYFFAHKISSPIMMYHFRDDEIIEYAQGEAYAKKLKELGKDVRFISGKGEHGFTSDLEEENQYRRIVDFFNTKLKVNYAK